MARKEIKDIKKGEIIILDGAECKVINLEFSEIGKHGTRKARITTLGKDGDTKVVIKPDSVLIETK